MKESGGREREDMRGEQAAEKEGRRQARREPAATTDALRPKACESPMSRGRREMKGKSNAREGKERQGWMDKIRRTEGVRKDGKVDEA
jgi:hypothetical protein